MDEQKKQQPEIRNVIMAGIIGSLLSIPAYLIPELSLLNILLPLPYILVFYKYGHQKGTLAILITSMSNGLILGTMGLIWSLIGFGLISVFLGGAYREKLNAVKTAILAVTAMVISQLLQYYIQTLFYPELLTEYAQLFIPFWQRLFIRDALPAPEVLIQEVLLILPGAKAASSIGVGLLYYYFSAYFLRLLGVEVERLKPLKDWAFPQILGLLWLLITGLLGFGILPLHVVIVTLLLGLTALLVVQGAAFFAYFITRLGLPGWARNILLALAILFGWIVLAFIGLGDNLLKTRRLFRQKRA